jgi:thiol-disulfide isomerase/thioredoxin
LERFLSKFKGKMLVLGSENCPSCRELKERVRSSEAAEEFSFVDVEKSEEARGVAEALDLRSFPTVLRVEDVEGKLTVCVLGKNYEPEQCYEVEVEGDERG